MTADCADSGSHWLHWSQLSRCSGFHAASQTDRLGRLRSHDRSENSAVQAPKWKAAEDEAETEAEIVEASAPEPLDAGNVNQSYRRADRRAVAVDS